ncbi:hypothetical protein [Prevotella sp. P4-119]|uniref:hypothetical protein n=1 Tax=Prevotella sp. P4-119 TaxID=2024218 RepID=UPI000B979546|nr:hypothetical protein [Prevotella sp. P4-119]OYP44565.1 hypothetical protein CIK89_05075 [Prevotella sp. P4-119]
MEKDNTVYQQRQWILDDYNSIVEEPESYGYDSIDGHLDEMIQDIKSDVDSVFKCNIDVSVIKNVITEYEDKRKNSPVVQ